MTDQPEILLYICSSFRRARNPKEWRLRNGGAPVGVGTLVAQAARHASVAVVGAQDVARARPVPEDVWLVAAEVVAGDGVVPGLRISFAVRIHRDHDPARDTGGPRGDVAREVVGRNLHVPRAKKRDPDPREVPVEFRGSTRARIVLDRVGFHLEATYRSLRKSVSFDEHASAVVVDRVSDDKASFRVGDVHAPRAARDVIANDLGVVVGPFRPEDDDARFTGAAYVVGEDLGAGRFDDTGGEYGAVRDVVGDDPGPGRVSDQHAEPVAYEVVLLDGGVGDPVMYLDRVCVFGHVSDDVLRDSGVRTDLNIDAISAFGVAYDIIVLDSGVDAPRGKADPGGIAYGAVSRNGGVAGVENVDRECR